MLFEVLTAITWVTIYAQSSQKINLTPKQAISSQSFIREDIPVSYKYTAIHDNAKEKPTFRIKEQYPYHLESKNNIKGIQYAPLTNEKPKYELYTRAAYIGTTESTTTETTKALIRKDHLEPKQNVNNLASFDHVPYIIPGYNIQIMQSANRSPGHNAFYRSYPQNIQKVANVPPNPRNQINFQRAFKIYKMPDVHIVSQVPKNPSVDLRALNHDMNLYTFYAHYGDEGKHFNNAGEKVLVKHVSYPQTRKLLLNLARTYNSTDLPSKHTSHADKLENDIANQSVIFNIERPGYARNTRLYPIAQDRFITQH